VTSWEKREKFITRRPPIGEKDDYDSENSWISDGLPSSSRRRRRLVVKKTSELDGSLTDKNAFSKQHSFMK